MLGSRLGTIHNLTYYENLMAGLRGAIEDGSLDETIAGIKSAYTDDSP